MAMSFLLLWSCQTEDAVTSQAPAKAIGPSEDGIPQPNYDMYNFATTQYYHNSKSLKDTTAIKNLLSEAKAVHIDGKRTEIFFTEQEAAAFKRKSDAQVASVANRAVTALDGDNYLHYFLEKTSSRIWSVGVSRDRVLSYLSVVGPITYNAQVTDPSYVSYVYDQAASGIFGLLNQYKTPVFRATTKLSDKSGDAGTVGSIFYSASFNTKNDFTFNVVNTTTHRRRVVIVAESGVTTYIDLAPKARHEVNGIFTKNNSGNHTYTFGSFSNYKIIKHYSDKI